MNPAQTQLPCTYHYDPLDRLAARLPASGSAEQHFYAHDQLATQVSGAIRQTLMRSDTMLLACQRHEQDRSDTALLAGDPQQSVLAATQPGSHQSFSYSPYGTRQPPTGFMDLPAFTGQPADPFTGHYLLGNGYRAYNPVLMRFNSPDRLSPFGRGGLNAYAYCQGDPANRVDPTGHWPSLIKGLRLNIDTIANPNPTPNPIPEPTQRSRRTSVVDLVKQSLVPNTNPSTEVNVPRQMLDEGARAIGAESDFAQAVVMVNRNQGSYGDRNLSVRKALKYLGLITDVRTRKTTSTTAFISSAYGWALDTEAPLQARAVGLGFNTAGSLISAAKEKARYSTGDIMFDTQSDIRTS